MSEQEKKRGDINITNNYYAPIGQHIDHVDTVNFTMDGDGTFHFGQVEKMESGRWKKENDEQEASIPEAEELNYFGPTNSLQRLLKQPWWTKVRSSKEYDAQWTDAFVVALMASEWRDAIARDWAVQGKRNKRMQIKGYVIGLLIDAGVLKGGYDSVASKMGVENARSLSKYMGMGKKQPYAEWVRKYV